MFWRLATKTRALPDNNNVQSEALERIDPLKATPNPLKRRARYASTHMSYLPSLCEKRQDLAGPRVSSSFARRLVNAACDRTMLSAVLDFFFISERITLPSADDASTATLSVAFRRVSCHRAAGSRPSFTE